jgi:hypothetical protein
LAVVVAEDGRVRMVNAAARALWRVEVDDALPAWLAGLPEGRWIERPVETGVQDVHVVPFDTAAAVAHGGARSEGGARGRLLVGEDVSQRVSDRARLARSERLALVGQLLGEKTVLNEFYAYVTMGQMIEGGTLVSERAQTLAVYILCGFANFASIGIQIGGIGTLAPDRRKDLSELGFKAVLGGTAASLTTATLVAFLL